MTRLVLACVLLVLLHASAAETSGGFQTSSRARQAETNQSEQLAVALENIGLSLGDAVFIRIFKESSELEVWLEAGGRFKLFRSYSICRYSGSLGPKLREGDGQSPEGFYFVTPSRMNPWSRFHLSFNLGFPNAYDRFHGRTGSHLMVHGSCVSIGCYAMTDEGIEEIYTLAAAALTQGQQYIRVHVFPFRMTRRNFRRFDGTRWGQFWKNLKTGHDWFERTGRPPDVQVRGGLYVFSTS
jgi:murein L,D-transpeptidase YafK